MSALTDLFTALANKIRSKTGTATTYTPLQMVSDGIDDVYAAGYDAGGGGATGIPITPSNASPVSLTSGDSYQMLANGYAISSYNNLSPSNSTPAALADDTIYKTNGTGYAIDSYTSVTPSNSSPASLTSGSIYKMGGAGKAVASVTDITPSDSSPASMSSGSVYKAGAAGYAIESNPTSITPSSSGTAFSAGITKMESSGYAYTESSGETTLWTNSAPSNNFYSSTVTLSQSIANFKYIIVYFRPIKASYGSETRVIVSRSELEAAIAMTGTARFALACYYSNTNFSRVFSEGTGTSISFGGCWKQATSSSQANEFCVPTRICGANLIS